MSRRIRVPEVLAERLHTETHLIHRSLESQALVTNPYSSAPNLDEIKDRLEQVQSEGLFYGADGVKSSPISWQDLVLAQAEVARVHGLVYEKRAGGKSGWIKASVGLDPDIPPRSRAHGYLSSVFSTGERQTFSRLDLALLAHCYQIPLSVLEAGNREVFDAYVAETIAGRDSRGVDQLGSDLFLPSEQFLLSRVKSDPQLSILPEENASFLLPELERQERAFVIIPPPMDLAEIHVGQKIAALAMLKRYLGSNITACLIANDGSGWELLSTNAVMGDNLFSLPGNFTIPPLSKIGQTGHGISTSSEGKFHAVLIAGKSPFKLNDMPAIIRSRPETLDDPVTTRLTDLDFDWLRERLLSSKPENYRVLRRTVLITKPQVVTADMFR